MSKQDNMHQYRPDGGTHPHPPTTIAPAEMSGGLGELLRLIWWNKRWIAIWLGLCLAAALLYILFSTRTYTATAQLLMETRNPQILQSMSLIPGLTADTQLIESQIELMRSKPILKMAIQKLREQTNQKSKPAQKNKADGNKKTPPPVKRLEPTEAQIDKYTEKLAINRKGLTYLVIVEYTDEDRLHAAKAANAMIDSYIDNLQTNRRNVTRAANKWLHDSIRLLRNELQEAEEKVLRFESENQLSQIGGTTLFERELTDAANQIAVARTNRARALARLQQVQKLTDDPERLTGMGEVLLSGVIQQYRRQLSNVQRELAKATSLYGPNSEKAREAQVDLKNVRAQLKSEVGRIIEKYRNDFEIASNQVDIMKRQITEIEQQVSTRHKQQVILAELRRQATAISQLYVSLLTRAKETKSQESLQLIDVRIISHAAAPTLPSYPRKGLALGLALIFGLGAGTITSVIAGHMHPYLRSPEQIENALGLMSPIALPVFKDTMTGAPTEKSHTDEVQLQRQTLHNANSQYSQSLFTLFNIIDENHIDSANGKIIAVISAKNDEGKSTTAINLADQAALAGHKTLLIDADLRRSHLTAGIPVKNKVDLLDAVKTERELAQVLPQMGENSFWFCAAPATEKYERPMNLLASKDIGRLLEKVRQEFEIILIDTTSLLDEVDAQGIIQHCDLTVLVIGWGMTTPSEIEQVFERARTQEQSRNSTLAILNRARNNLK